MDSGTASTWQFSRNRNNAQRTYASGVWAIAICDRCGWKYPWKALTTEPGTGWKVCSTCNDGRWSLVAHPQNYPAVGTDAIALPWSRPDQNPNITQPYYLATEDGYVLTWSQDYIIQTGVSNQIGDTGDTFSNVLNWQSPPFGYQD